MNRDEVLIGQARAILAAAQRFVTDDNDTALDSFINEISPALLMPFLAGVIERLEVSV